LLPYYDSLSCSRSVNFSRIGYNVLLRVIRIAMSTSSDPQKLIQDALASPQPEIALGRAIWRLPGLIASIKNPSASAQLASVVGFVPTIQVIERPCFEVQMIVATGEHRHWVPILNDRIHNKYIHRLAAKGRDGLPSRL
jgi:hypothetical protein